MVVKSVQSRLWTKYWIVVVFILAILAIQVFLQLLLYSAPVLEDDIHSGNKWLPKESSTKSQVARRKDESKSSAGRAASHLDIDSENEDDNEVLSVPDNKYEKPSKSISRNHVPDHQLSQSRLSGATTRESSSNGKASSNSNRVINYEELDFKPECEITTKEAISALNRATTQKCKKEIASIACAMQRKDLYPQTLPRYCPYQEGKFGDYLGCFRDASKSRILSSYATKMRDNSPSKCLNLCLRSGYRFAGVEYGNQCFCGRQMPATSAKISKSFCNMSCPMMHGLNEAPKFDFCGGYFAIDIYRTGLAKPIKHEPSPEDDAKDLPPVRIAFIFTVNGRALRQVKRVLRNLYDTRHFYYFHIDQRQDYLYRKLRKLESAHSNIKVATRRLSTIWGGASLLKVLLNAISDLLRTPGWSHSWDYVINLSESDFPIKTLKQLELFLTANKGKNFVKSHGQDTQRFIAKQGLDKTFYECDAHMWRLGDRELPNGIRLDGGSDWIGLSRDFCSYLITANDTLLRGLDTIYQHTLLPAESYFHTALQNSKFCDTIIDNNLHVTNWRRKQGCKCQYKHIVDWCGCSPNDFKQEDWQKIQVTEQNPLYFARKFEPVISHSIINRVEQWVAADEELARNPSYNKYWQSLYHHEDISPHPDDGQLSVFRTLSLLSLKRLGFMCENALNHHAEVLDETHEVNEATLYFEDDALKGILISFTTMHLEQHTSYELYAKPISHFQVHKRPGPIERLLALQACSGFDPKEQMFRNFGCILSPFSELAALHKWAVGSENFTVSFVWLDPASVIAGTYEVKVDAGEQGGGSLVLHHKPTFRQPLRPGTWKLLMLYNWALVAETRFLVTPLLYYNAKRVGSDQVKFLNNGPSQKYVDHNFTAIENYLRVREKQAVQLRVAATNARRFGEDLQRWADSGVAEFWTIQEICVAEGSLPCKGAHLASCRQTSWSSFSPDLKSRLPLKS